MLLMFHREKEEPIMFHQLICIFIGLVVIICISEWGTPGFKCLGTVQNRVTASLVNWKGWKWWTAWWTAGTKLGFHCVTETVRSKHILQGDKRTSQSCFIFRHHSVYWPWCNLMWGVLTLAVLIMPSESIHSDCTVWINCLYAFNPKVCA